MDKEILLLISASVVFLTSYTRVYGQSAKTHHEQFQPLTFEQADKKADSVLTLMTMDEKIALVGGDRSFFIRPLSRLNLQEVYMSDATQGVHIREKFTGIDLSKISTRKINVLPSPYFIGGNMES
jgi:beta-glucosidase